MKNLLCMLLAITLCFSLSSCGGNSPEQEASKNNSNASDEEQAESSKSDESTKSKDQITFDGVTVVDNDECSISITEIESDNMWGYTLKTQLENKSNEKAYMFSVITGAVNGVQIDPFFAKEVVAGKKANSEISFNKSELEQIGTPTDIELFFRVYDSNDWTAENVAEESVHVYPYGEDHATMFEREMEDTDLVIAENEYIKVTALGYEYDSIWGYTINLFLENKSDAEIMFSVNDASINGYMMDPFWANSVLPGKCAFSSMYWSNTALEENGIDEVSEVEFLFKAYDSNDWFADSFFEDIITLTA